MVNELRDLGCDFAQGFHLGRPLPAAEFERWMRERPLTRASASESASLICSPQDACGLSGAPAAKWSRRQTRTDRRAAKPGRSTCGGTGGVLRVKLLNVSMNSIQKANTNARQGTTRSALST